MILRQVGATSYNDGSSRSHTILRIAVESSATAGSAAAARGDPQTLSFLNLIDLAGSESARVRALLICRHAAASEGCVNKSDECLVCNSNGCSKICSLFCPWS